MNLPQLLIALAFSVLISTNVVTYTKYQVAQENFEANKKAYRNCEREIDTLQKQIDTLLAPLTPELLQYKLEIVSKDFPWSKDFASYFTAIARRESGDRFCNGASLKTNCPFGFNKRPRSEYVIGYYENGYGETLCCYENIESALCDALMWTLRKPPTGAIVRFDTCFLKRRGYNNHVAGYYADIERLRLK